MRILCLSTLIVAVPGAGVVVCASAVAKAAVTAGADMVNDVSGGTFDPDMLPTVRVLLGSGVLKGAM